MEKLTVDLKKQSRQICSLGLWDDTIPGISFDSEGVSNYAKIQRSMMEDNPIDERGATKWQKLLTGIKAKGEKKDYDCIIGVSGGTDSSYLLHLAVESGLRPLAVNLDNGWSSDIAVSNIKKMTQKLGVDLETYVIDYEEIKDLLRAYMRAGLPWIDNPTDQAIHAVLYKIASREGVKMVLIGTDFRSEGKQPTEWTYSDYKQLKHIHRKFGEVRLKTYPTLSLFQLICYGYIKRIKQVSPFVFLPYDKASAQEFLEKTYNWKYYGEHHHENLFTKWAIGYWMFEKHGIDKRKITYSAQVLNGKLDRENALEIVSKLPYKKELEESDTDYVLKKLSISPDEFKNIWESENKSYVDYPSYYPMIKRMTRLLIPVLKYILPVKPKIFYEMEGRQDE